MLTLDCYNHNKQQQLEKLVQLNLCRLLNAGLFFCEFFKQISKIISELILL